MSASGKTEVRRLGPGDEEIVRRLAENEPQTALLADERTIFVAAFDGEETVGFAVDAYILEEGGEPVGYLQAWWEPDEPKRGGLDGFLIPEARGRGIMPALARELAEARLADGWQHVTVDPYVWNERAIRGWANAGFVEISRDEKVVLMRYGG